MKKILIFTKPLVIATLSLLLVSCFLRYYLIVNSEQLAKEFKNQNFREIYSSDTLKISSRLNSLASVINWVCIEGSVADQVFYKLTKGPCHTGLIQQKVVAFFPEANNTKIVFTVRLPVETEWFFSVFLVLQSILIIALIVSTKKNEEEKRIKEIIINKLARQMSHDIRSPLATLNTIINDLKSIPTDELTLLLKSIKQINDISNNLLNKYKNSNEKEHPLPRLSSTNIVNKIDEILNSKRVEYSNYPNIKFYLNNDSKNKAINCLIDEIEFMRSISNLLNNSVEAIPNTNFPLNIIITIATRSQCVEIKISDNGIGINPETLKSIGKNEVTTKKMGNGLGIIHTFENIHNWNGEIEISSIVNNGTTIKIVLPTLEMTYVLIDDDELVRLTWTSRAIKNNINLFVFPSSRELLETLSTFSANAIFYIDSELENEKGEDIAKALHNKGFTNLNMCSGHGDDKFSHLSFIQSTIGKAPPF